jgi:SHS2 domain-containing protein
MAEAIVILAAGDQEEGLHDISESHVLAGSLHQANGIVGRFCYIEEVALADCALEIEGGDLNDLFATAAAALAALMVDPATVPETIEREVTLAAEAYDMLLYDWLAELILRKDRDREIFPTADVVVDGGEAALTARLRGAPIDDRCMSLRNDPKAVTLHRFGLERTARGWRARVVIDV